MSDDGEAAILAAIDRLRGDMKVRMDRLQDRVAALTDDTAISLGVANHVRRVHANTREEVRSLADVQSAMVERILGLDARVRSLEDKP